MSLEFRGQKVTRISVEPRVAFARELYIGIAWDTAARLPAMLLSVAGVVPLATPSTVMLAPDGVELAAMVPVVGSATSVPLTVAVWPAVTVTDWVSDW